MTATQSAELEPIRSCVFWHRAHEAWSTVGCEVASYSATETVCSCNHLTEFAVSVRYRNRMQTSPTVSVWDQLVDVSKYGLLGIGEADMGTGRVRVTLDATNIFGKKRSTEIIFQDAAAPEPNAFIVAPKSGTFTRSRELVLGSYAAVPECLPVDSTFFTYQLKVARRELRRDRARLRDLEDERARLVKEKATLEARLAELEACGATGADPHPGRPPVEADPGPSRGRTWQHP